MNAVVTHRGAFDTPVASAPVKPVRGARRTKVAIRTVDPWSVFRFSLVFSVTVLIVWIAVAAVLWSLLHSMGVLQSVTDLINDLFPSKVRTADELFNFKKIMIWATGLGVINAILFTALGTLGSFVYNLCSQIVGGIEVTLGERD